MSVTIRTRLANGCKPPELYPSDAAGRAALARNLGEHERRGHRIVWNFANTVVTVEDENGVFLQESEIVAPT